MAAVPHRDPFANAPPPIRLAETGPLSAADLEVVRRARGDSKKIRRCASVAAFSGWTAAIFGGVTLLTSIGSWAAMALGAGLLVSGIVEIRAGREVGRFREAASRILAINQCVLGLVLCSYAVYKLQGDSVAELVGQVKSGDAQIDATIEELGTLVQRALYGTLAVLGIVIPGLTALYYFTRGAIIRRFVERTPSWAVELLRAKDA
jgi:hypothetical protein